MTQPEGASDLPLSTAPLSSGSPRSKQQQQSQLVSLRGRESLFAAGAVLLVIFAVGWLVGWLSAPLSAANRFHRGSTLVESDLCALGSLPGTWVSGGPPGTRWRLLHPTCQLKNMLALYSGSSSDAAEDDGVDSDADSVDNDAAQQPSSGDDAPSRSKQGPAIRLLLLSDSVDRFITGHLCELIGGQQEAQVAQEMLPAAQADGSVPIDSAGRVRLSLRQRQRQRRKQLQLRQWLSLEQLQQQAQGEQQPDQQVAAQQPLLIASTQEEQQHAAPTAAEGPTNVYTTAYSLHKCVSSSPLKIASSYYPGVHPTGPWHRNVAQSYRQRIDSAASLWKDFAGDAAPHLVVSDSGWMRSWKSWGFHQDRCG